MVYAFIFHGIHISSKELVCFYEETKNQYGYKNDKTFLNSIITDKSKILKTHSFN